jgi:hypothetical protein
MAAFFVFQPPGVGLEGCKGALKESIVHYVGFAVFALHNPVAFRHVAEADVGSNRFCVFTLARVYQ